MAGDAPMSFPTKPGDWVSDGGQIALVKAVDWDGTEYIVDLVMYDRNGEKLGRVSPVMGGPRTFEPCCPWRYWHRVLEPNFPLVIRTITDHQTGRRRLDYDYGSPLPDREWQKPKRKSRGRRISFDPALDALRQIAAGHNDARGLAQAVLNRRSAT